MIELVVYQTAGIVEGWPKVWVKQAFVLLVHKRQTLPSVLVDIHVEFLAGQLHLGEALPVAE